MCIRRVRLVGSNEKLAVHRKGDRIVGDALTRHLSLRGRRERSCHILVLLRFLLNVSDLLRQLLKRILVVLILALKLCRVAFVD